MEEPEVMGVELVVENNANKKHKARSIQVIRNRWLSVPYIQKSVLAVQSARRPRRTKGVSQEFPLNVAEEKGLMYDDHVESDEEKDEEKDEDEICFEYTSPGTMDIPAEKGCTVKLAVIVVGWSLIQMICVAVLVIPSILVFENPTKNVKVIRSVLILDISMGVVLLVLSIVLALWLYQFVWKPLTQFMRSFNKLKRLDFSSNHGPVSPSGIYELTKLQTAFCDLKATFMVIEKFIPRAVVRDILRDKDFGQNLRVKYRTVTIMFCDLRDFSKLSERMELHDLLVFLTGYLTKVSETVEAYQGIVSEIQGDGVLAFWGSTENCDNHSSKACVAALALQECVVQLNEEFAHLLDRYDLEPFSLRIGVHRDKVLAGILGCADKMKFGCLGDGVNLASRLEGLCKVYGVGIICSAECYKHAQHIVGRKLDKVVVVGRSQPTTIYEVVANHAFIDRRGMKVISPDSPITKALSEIPGALTNRLTVRSYIEDTMYLAENGSSIKKAYILALENFEAGKFQQAKSTLEDALQNNKDEFVDKPSLLLMERIQSAISKHGHEVQSEHWDSTFWSTSK